MSPINRSRVWSVVMKTITVSSIALLAPSAIIYAVVDRNNYISECDNNNNTASHDCVVVVE